MLRRFQEVLAVLLLAGFAAPAQTLPTVYVLATGGTIASRQNLTSLSGEQLVDAVPALKKIAKIQTEQMASVGSRDITPAIWLALAARANALLARADVTGIVITHGTDTLEETAYFLDLTVNSDKPVVMVASQRPASDPDSDGPRNLLDAVRVAVSPEAPGKGVLVVLNGQISAARDVTKTHTSQVETFRSLEVSWALPMRKPCGFTVLRCDARRFRWMLRRASPESRLFITMPAPMDG
jgi:L-asparaginase